MDLLLRLLEQLKDLGEEFSCVLGKAPLKDIFIGIIVPLVSAFLSYFLVNRVSSKKEANKLYIQLELLKREFSFNKERIQQFIQTYSLFSQKKEALQLKLPFAQEVLYQVLICLSKIQDDYFCFENFTFESPNCLIILDDEIKKLKLELDKTRTEMEHMSKYNNASIMQNISTEIIKLEKEIKIKSEELRKNITRDIYKEFINIQKEIDQSKVMEMYGKKNEDTLLNTLKYIYSCIKEFNEINPKNKSDIINIYKSLLLYEIRKDDIIENDIFDESIFDFYYKERYGQHPMLHVWKNFYHYNILSEKLINFSMDIKINCWYALKDDLVLLNNRQLYILIDDCYKDMDCINDTQNILEETVLLQTNKKCLKLKVQIEIIEKSLLKKEIEIQKKIVGRIIYYIKILASWISRLIRKIVYRLNPKHLYNKLKALLF
ncbi:MAG: hypothetical protein PHI90_08960 [Clostridia bacterium]|nr:hypothetical protein [Clostridia bacterium]